MYKWHNLYDIIQFMSFNISSTNNNNIIIIIMENMVSCEPAYTEHRLISNDKRMICYLRVFVNNPQVENDINTLNNFDNR